VLPFGYKLREAEVGHFKTGSVHDLLREESVPFDRRMSIAQRIAIEDGIFRAYP
jgi:hypothetical protein